jgi:hypothetical protein
LTDFDGASPDWTAAMRPGHWYRISGDTPDLDLTPTRPGTRYLIDNDPARDPNLNPAHTVKERLRRMLGREALAPWRGRGGFSAITEAWNSAVYASRHGRAGAMIVFGGGHADYYGADVHAFDLHTRTWQRISDGWLDGTATDYGDGACYAGACYPNGSPLPPHTYDYVQYDPVGNDLLLAKGQLELGEHVKAVAMPHLFNLDTRHWRHGPRHPDAILNAGGCSTWDATRRCLWIHSGDDGGGNAFIAFTPDGDNGDGTYGRWAERQPNKLPGTANHNAMAFAPEHDHIVFASHGRDAIGTLDPKAPAAPITWLAAAGTPARIRAFAALQHAPSLGSVVYAAPAHAGALYAIETDAPTAHWRRLDAPDRSLDPFADAARVSRFAVSRDHCFGRLRIATFTDATLVVLVRHVDSPVYALRLER